MSGDPLQVAYSHLNLWQAEVELIQVMVNLEIELTGHSPENWVRKLTNAKTRVKEFEILIRQHLLNQDSSEGC